MIQQLPPQATLTLDVGLVRQLSSMLLTASYMFGPMYADVAGNLARFADRAVAEAAQAPPPLVPTEE